MKALKSDNPAFKTEPIILHNRHVGDIDVKLNDIPRNKFFDKPKNNFKKR